ncbi:MAG TPA: hypothetical protein VMW94_10345 [Actinomycetes bacterium]|nr:hypothetical protein [Actinomycetes bacterium]
MATSIAVTLPAPTIAASSAFTVAMLRAYVTSTLSDAVLQTYLDAAMEAIDDVLGPVAMKERINVSYGELVRLGRKAASITSVVEDARSSSLTLAADDYELTDSGEVLYRLHDGTNPRYTWHSRVDVTYVREDDVADRIRVAVALVRLDLTYAPGLTSQQIGTWSETYATTGSRSYEEQRADLLGSLTEMVGFG